MARVRFRNRSLDDGNTNATRSPPAVGVVDSVAAAAVAVVDGARIGDFDFARRTPLDEKPLILPLLVALVPLLPTKQ